MQPLFNCKFSNRLHQQNYDQMKSFCQREQDHALSEVQSVPPQAGDIQNVPVCTRALNTINLAGIPHTLIYIVCCVDVVISFLYFPVLWKPVLSPPVTSHVRGISGLTKSTPGVFLSPSNTQLLTQNTSILSR